MRITVLNQFYAPDISATAGLAASLAEHLANRGHQVTVVTSRGGYVPQSVEEKKSTSVNPFIHRVWTPQLGKATIVRRLTDYGMFYLLATFRLIFMPRQDVIISLTTPPFIVWAALLHKFFRRTTKVVLWHMDAFPELAERSHKIKEHGLLSSFMRFANRAMFKRLAHLICLDTAMVDLLCSQYAPKINPPPVSIIPNWEKIADFPANAKYEPWHRVEEHNLADRFILLYMGNAGQGHDFQTIINAAQQMKDDPITFLFVGGGIWWPKLKEYKQEKNLDNLVLQDYVPDDEVSPVLATADCSIITLRNSILGVMSPSKLHACLAMRLPIVYVGPKGCNVDDAINHFNCGISLRHGQTDQLVQYIRQLIADPDKLKQLRLTAREAYEQAYCDTKTLIQFDTVIESLRDDTNK